MCDTRPELACPPIAPGDTFADWLDLVIFGAIVVGEFKGQPFNSPAVMARCRQRIKELRQARDTGNP